MLPGFRRRIHWFLLLLLLFSAIPLSAQGTYYVKEHYTKFEYMVPMRDGIRLFTEVYVPKDLSHEYPILLKRTPYGVGTYGGDLYKSTLGPSASFGRERYIFVYQDIRGKFRSEGIFEHHRPYIRNKAAPQDTDEASDAFDTVEWLTTNISGHNGRVGMWGISYPGWLAVMALIEPHPAVLAVSPQASPGDQWIGDDYYHNGAFRLMYAFDWTWQCAQIREGPTESEPGEYDYATADGYRFFLDLGPIANVNNRCFHGRIPMWNELIEHWTYDEYWQAKNVPKDLNNIQIPVLNVVGWFDAEDFYGPMSIYSTIERTTPANRNSLVVGPWNHGGWAYSSGESLGKIRFNSTTAAYYREQVELPFFNYYLKDKGSLNLPEVLVFETGANLWRSYESWPPRQAVERRLYLQPDQGLSFRRPHRVSTSESFDSFVSDPSNPVPYTAEMGTIQGHLWMVEDQRFTGKRSDVLVYQSEVLEEEVRIAGPITADLYVSTTGTDADWVVKLIDVYPEDASNGDSGPDGTMGDGGEPEPGKDEQTMAGFQMLLAGEVIRSKFRNSYTEPQAMIPGRVTRITFSLLDRHHTFGKGHRIMVQLQSSWFPLIDRNPQAFLSIPEARTEDFRSAIHRVYHSPDHPSSLILSLLEQNPQ
ncbi:MAG: CocE/NonD family hydrolase [Spirochaetaceae bacterium]|nr:MAG: CocE/NonD family hydrolase [Spirochaetaceae bacterium]